MKIWQLFGKVFTRQQIFILLPMLIGFPYASGMVFWHFLFFAKKCPN
jgi:hypothetical protein